MRLTIRCLFALALLSLPSDGIAHPSQFRFQRIADTSTLIPGFTSRFEEFESPALDDGLVAFTGSNANGDLGVFRVNDGAFTTLVNSTTNYGGFRISGAGGVALDNGVVAALVSTRRIDGSFLNRRIMFGSGGSLTTVSFSQSSSGPEVPVIHDGRIAYRYFGEPNNGSSVRVYFNGNTTVIAQTGMTAPGGLGVFGHVGTVPAANSSVTAFQTYVTQGPGTGSQTAMYARRGSTLSLIAAEGTIVPDLGLPLNPFGDNPILDGGNVLFNGTAGEDRVRAYLLHDGVSLRSVGMHAEPIADLTGETLGSLALTLADYENGQRLFRGNDQPIFVDRSGEIIEVIGQNDILDGRIVRNVDLSNGAALSNGQIAFKAWFTDGTSGVYLADPVPEPSSCVLVASAILGGLALRRRRGRQLVKIGGASKQQVNRFAGLCLCRRRATRLGCKA